MPIRPENRDRYPKDWPAISMRIRVESEWRCEFCSAQHGEPHPITDSIVVLTVAHLDHTPENCERENLKALCQRCHNRYDADHRKSTRAKTREAEMVGAGQTRIPGLDGEA